MFTVALSITQVLERHLQLNLKNTLYQCFHEELHLATCADLNLREVMKAYFNLAYLQYEQSLI